MAAETVAMALHETYERLAPSFYYTTRAKPALSWDDIPYPNRSLMIAVVAELIEKGIIKVEE